MSDQPGLRGIIKTLSHDHCDCDEVAGCASGRGHHSSGGNCPVCRKCRIESALAAQESEQQNMTTKVCRIGEHSRCNKVLCQCFCHKASGKPITDEMLLGLPAPTSEPFKTSSCERGDHNMCCAPLGSCVCSCHKKPHPVSEQARLERERDLALISALEARETIERAKLEARLVLLRDLLSESEIIEVEDGGWYIVRTASIEKRIKQDERALAALSKLDMEKK